MTDSGPSTLERFNNGIGAENPIFRQILGMCPTLAVTNTVKGAMTMAAAVAFVLICSNIIVSLLRNLLKPHLRILVFTLTIATFVTIADKLLAAFVPDMSRRLGPYVPLIIVNCIIIARCEVCAAKQGIMPAIGDALGQSIGNAVALLAVSSVREILGDGRWLGWTVYSSVPGTWESWSIMILPPGAFLTLGLLLGAVNWVIAAAKRPSVNQPAADAAAQAEPA
ncbi:MAG: electron transport complex subunit RsxE [Planctomycetaceae bacterium]|nr:electron transport complex subunit RsxE [Planctomycetaceae bacterium]